MIELLMRKHLAGFKAKKILDVGPGFNNFGRVAAEVCGGEQIDFLDCNTEVLDWQKQECAKAGIASEAHVMLLKPEELAAIASRYDLILCQEVLEHLINAEEILAAIVGLLNPGGRMVITVPTGCSEKWLSIINPGYMKNESFGHVRRFSRKALCELASQAGLSVIELIPAQPQYFVFHTWLYLTRVEIEGSTGRIVTQDWRTRFGSNLIWRARRFFDRTGIGFWSRLIPRNYFLIAERGGEKR